MEVFAAPLISESLSVRTARLSPIVPLSSILLNSDAGSAMPRKPLRVGSQLTFCDDRLWRTRLGFTTEGRDDDD